MTNNNTTDTNIILYNKWMMFLDMEEVTEITDKTIFPKYLSNSPAIKTLARVVKCYMNKVMKISETDKDLIAVGVAILVDHIVYRHRRTDYRVGYRVVFTSIKPEIMTTKIESFFILSGIPIDEDLMEAIKENMSMVQQLAAVMVFSRNLRAHESDLLIA